VSPRTQWSAGDCLRGECREAPKAQLLEDNQESNPGATKKIATPKAAPRELERTEHCSRGSLVARKRIERLKRRYWRGSQTWTCRSFHFDLPGPECSRIGTVKRYIPLLQCGVTLVVSGDYSDEWQYQFMLVAQLHQTHPAGR